MAEIRLSVALDPDTLLRNATRGLFPLPTTTHGEPWPTLPVWLVLRQGGLRDDVHRLAAQAGCSGWFDPPVCLFAEVAPRWGASSVAALTEQERLALLSAVVARRAHGIFDRGGSAEAWVPAIDRLLGELLSEGVSPEAFRTAISSRSDQDASERERDERLAGVFADWVQLLDERGRVDGRDQLVRLAHDIVHDPHAFAQRLGGRRELRIVGLADLRGGWKPLLTALRACTSVDTVTLFASHALPLPASLDAIVEQVEVQRDNALDAVSSLPLCAGAQVAFVEAPDAAREVEQIAVRVRALLDSRSATPDRIAVVTRQARPGVDALADALESMGVPVTARRRAALSQSGPARALRALLHAAAENFSRHAVLELSEQPLLALRFDADVLQAAAQSSPITALGEWEPAMRRLLARCEAREADSGDWRSQRGLPETARVARTLAAWMEWLPDLTALATARTDGDWFAWAMQVLTDARWGVTTQLNTAPADDERVRRADVRARDQILALSNEWVRALGALDETLTRSSGRSDAEVFARRLALVLDADVITQPETSFGVVVAEALAAGWRAFDHVFVVGLVAGEFPRRPPPSALMSDRDRRALMMHGLSLDAPDSWRARERALFDVLCAAPRQRLTLSWSSMDGEGREVARSAYVDDAIDARLAALDLSSENELEATGDLVRIPAQQVLTPGFPIVARGHEAAVVHASAAATHEAGRSNAPTAYNGQIEDAAMHALLDARYGEAYNWSATQLEELAKCAWSWFASRVLKLEQRGDLTEQMEPTTRGSLLHDALDRFFADARRRTGAPAFLRETDRPWAEPALRDALDSAWSTLSSTEWLGSPALHDITRAELAAQLQRYLDFEIGYNEKSYNNKTNASRQIRMGAFAGEMDFANVALGANGVSFRLRGLIDRVDIGVDDRIPDSEQYIAAIDYKSSIGSAPAGGKASGWKDGVVLQVPLYALALRQLSIGGSVRSLARLEYRTLKRPKAVHTLDFVTLKLVKKERELQEVPEAEDALAGALSHAAAKVQQARTGVLPASPTDSCGCSPYCVARDICRIPNGPREVR